MPDARRRLQTCTTHGESRYCEAAAIAVLIFATLGALMWVAFKAIWGDASSRTSTQVTKIGS